MNTYRNMGKEFVSLNPIEININTSDEETKYISIQEIKITTNEDNKNVVNATVHP